MKVLIPAILLVAMVAAVVGNQWQLLAVILRDHGIWAGGAIIAFFGAHWWIYHQYEMRIAAADARVADRQKDIENLLAENKEYRDKFMQLIGRIQLKGER